MKRRFGHGLVISLLTLTGLLALAQISAFGADPVDDETCGACHEGYIDPLNHGPHQLASQATAPRTDLACVSCHPGGETHIDDPTPDNIGNPATMSNELVDALCADCHQPHLEMTVTGFDPHVGTDMNCTSCHSVHNGSHSLLLDDKGDFCGQCHVGAKNDFMKRSNHPLMEDNVSCLSCHDFTGDAEPMFGHGAGANCYSCHPQQAGPFRFEHEAASSFSVEGGDGCVSCHQPHGSGNDRLLNQPGDRLCMQCHGTPPLHRTAHSGLATNYDCMECHSDIHGSYDNPSLLDANLGTKIGSGPGSCYCHNVDN